MLLLQIEDAHWLLDSTAPVLLIQIEDVVGCQHNVVDPNQMCVDEVKEVSVFSKVSKGFA